MDVEIHPDSFVSIPHPFSLHAIGTMAAMYISDKWAMLPAFLCASLYVFTELAPLTLLGSTCPLPLSSNPHPCSLLSVLSLMDNQ